jgi:tetraacyldisaccharide 4'-kinase
MPLRPEANSRAALEQWLTRQWMARGPGACLLWPLSLLMQVLVGARRWAYQRGWLQATVLPVPVIVVGNRIAGGAGKTPTVMAVLAWLKAQGYRPGVLTRGHGRPSGAGHGASPTLVLDSATQHQLQAAMVGDEPWLIWRRAQCPMAIDRDRARGALALLAAHPTLNILVCDDGLQHLALARQIEIVVFDERGQGNGWLIPAGPLREPINSPPHPNAMGAPLVLYNAPGPSTSLPGYLAKRRLASLQTLSEWWAGQPHASALPALSQQDCWAVAAIAQPQRFFDALRDIGIVATPCPMPDHDDLSELPWPLGVSHVIMTEKDAVKLTPERLNQERPGTQVWVAPLSFQIEDPFWQALATSLAHSRTLAHRSIA